MTATNYLNAQIISMINRCGGYVWRNNTGASRNGRLRFGKVGSGDVIGLWADGRFISVETKMGRDKASQAQLDFAKMVNDLGGMAIFACDIQDVIDMINQLRRDERIPFYP